MCSREVILILFEIIHILKGDGTHVKSGGCN